MVVCIGDRYLILHPLLPLPGGILVPFQSASVASQGVPKDIDGDGFRLTGDAAARCQADGHRPVVLQLRPLLLSVTIG